MKEKRNSTKKQVMEKNGITLIALVVLAGKYGVFDDKK